MLTPKLRGLDWIALARRRRGRPPSLTETWLAGYKAAKRDTAMRLRARSETNTVAVAGPKPINDVKPTGASEGRQSIKGEPAKSGLTTQAGLAESPNNRHEQQVGNGRWPVKERSDTALLNGLEAATEEGACPGAIFDDDGHWAVVDDGIQEVFSSEGPHELHTTFFVPVNKWKGTLRAAINAYLDERAAETQSEQPK